MWLSGDLGAVSTAGEQSFGLCCWQGCVGGARQGWEPGAHWGKAGLPSCNAAIPGQSCWQWVCSPLPAGLSSSLAPYRSAGLPGSGRTRCISQSHLTHCVPAADLLSLALEKPACLSDASVGWQVGHDLLRGQAELQPAAAPSRSLLSPRGSFPPDLALALCHLTVVGDKRQQLPGLPAGHTFL